MITKKLQIVESNLEPQNKNVLWLKGLKIHKWHGDGWEPITSGTPTSPPSTTEPTYSNIVVVPIGDRELENITDENPLELPGLHHKNIKDSWTAEEIYKYYLGTQVLLVQDEDSFSESMLLTCIGCTFSSSEEICMLLYTLNYGSKVYSILGAALPDPKSVFLTPPTKYDLDYMNRRIEALKNQVGIKEVTLEEYNNLAVKNDILYVIK